MSVRRRLVLADGIWRYRVHKRFVEIWTPAGRLVEVQSWAAAGETEAPQEWHDSCYDGDRITITPGLLRQYIEANRELL